MSDEEVKLTIPEAMVKGYHECYFAVRVGDKFVVKQKKRIYCSGSEGN